MVIITRATPCARHGHRWACRTARTVCSRTPSPPQASRPASIQQFQSREQHFQLTCATQLESLLCILQCRCRMWLWRTVCVSMRPVFSNSVTSSIVSREQSRNLFQGPFSKHLLSLSGWEFLPCRETLFQIHQSTEPPLLGLDPTIPEPLTFDIVVNPCMSMNICSTKTSRMMAACHEGEQQCVYIYRNCKW